MADRFTVIPGIDRPAVRAIPALRKAMEEAFRQLRDSLGDAELAEAILSQSAQPLLDSEAWGVFTSVAGDAFTPDGPLAQAILAAGRMAAGEAPLVGLALDMDLFEAKALQWVESHGAKLVRQVSDSTKAAIRQTIHDAFRGPTSLRQAARRMVEQKAFGLAPGPGREFEKWVKARMDAAADPRGDWFDLSEREINRRIEREFGKRVRGRARLIAKTEAYNAGNEGQIQVWREAVDQGKLDGEVYVLEWVTRIINVCPRCEALRGKLASIKGGQFVSDPVKDGRFAGQVIRVTRPTLHPGCYCTVQTKRKRPEDKVNMAAVLPMAA